MAQSVVIEVNSKGYLKDGRTFEIINFEKIAVASDGSIHSGLVNLYINGEMTTTMLSWLGENIDYTKVHNYELRCNNVN